MAARLKHTRILATAMCLLETKELALALRLSESFLWADYHPSLLCSRMDQRSLLPLNIPWDQTAPIRPLRIIIHLYLMSRYKTSGAGGRVWRPFTSLLCPGLSQHSHRHPRCELTEGLRQIVVIDDAHLYLPVD